MLSIQKNSGIFFKFLSCILLVILVILTLFPFYWAVVSSLKTELDIFKMPPDWIALNPTFTNYVDLFQKTKTITWAMNSFAVSLSVVVITCILSTFAGYAFARISFTGKAFVFGLIIATMLLPKYVMMVPLFKLMINLRWFNTYQGLIIPDVTGALPLGIFLIRQFMASQPKEIFESATIDGCGDSRLLAFIAVPLAKSAIASLAILVFVRSWNDYMWQLIVISKDAMKTLPLGLASLQTENVSLYGQILSGSVVTAFPLIAIFIMFQKYFVRGLSSGAVKG